MSRKVLVSRGFGAGWSSWHHVPTKFSCEYAPIIEAIERGETLTEEHPAVVRYVSECKATYDKTPYLGGLDGLYIETINDDEQYQIHEYDGSESIRLRSMEEWN